MTTYLNPGAIEGYSEAQQGKFLAKGADGIVFVDGGGGSSTLAELTDVAITTASESNMLSYDSATGKWVNRTEIDPSNLPEFSSSVTGQVLAKTGSDTAEFVTLTGQAPAYIDMTGIQAPVTDFYTKGQTDTLLDAKQDTLVSATNIKTLNSTSLLGSGDISIPNLSFHHITPTVSGGSLVFDSTLTEGYNRCYARVSTSANMTLTLSFTNTDEHYITVHNSGSADITVAVATVTGYTIIGNTAITIAAGKYYEISFLRSGYDYILTERLLTTA